MQVRVFTRRRHEIASHRLWVRLLAWCAAPAIVLMAGFKVYGAGQVGGLESVAVAIAALIYLRSVWRLHELTGDWKFF